MTSTTLHIADMTSDSQVIPLSKMRGLCYQVSETTEGTWHRGQKSAVTSLSLTSGLQGFIKNRLPRGEGGGSFLYFLALMYE